MLKTVNMHKRRLLRKAISFLVDPYRRIKTTIAQ